VRLDGLDDVLIVLSLVARRHFPGIANDIKYPPLFSPEQFFSSVLRIGSANTQLWTHYDIMDNMLVQVHGSKRLIMFKPSDIDYLYIDGDKSLVNNIEEPDFEAYPLVRQAVPYTGILQPGDCLFIPGKRSTVSMFNASLL
jgi:tRNA wybutosine-synthesizing protein 5